MNLPFLMKALQLQEIDKLVLCELLVPLPKANEVLIKTMATTICTSDLHDIKFNPFKIKLPNVLGHEGSGVIIACGADVKYLSNGMRVAAHPVVPCGYCEECKRGFGHLCLNMGHLGIDRNGTFAEYFIQRSDRVRILPQHVPFHLGALLEPVANCLQAIRRAGDVKNKLVYIIGDGPFGNIIARLAIRAGASKVLVSGRNAFRLEKIPGAEIIDKPPLKSVDIAILAVSSQEAFIEGMASLRKRGRLVVFSLLEGPTPVNLFDIHVSELEIVGCCNDEDMLDESLRCLQDPQLNLSELITQKIPFKNWEEAFYLARERHDKCLKVAITFD